MMCTSVPQIVVVVMRMSASSGPTSGIGFSSSAIRPGSTKMVTFIFWVIDSLHLFGVAGHALATQITKTGAKPPPGVLKLVVWP